MADMISQDELNALFGGLSTTRTHVAESLRVETESGQDTAKGEILDQDEIDRLLEMAGRV